MSPVLSRPRRPLSEPGVARKKALIIGINYTSTAGKHGFDRLYGAQRDAKQFKQLLSDQYGYQDSDVVLMIDRRGTPSELMPTRRNILRQISKLRIREARPGDQFVFYYAGHSGQIPCRHGSEDDGMDEAILPMDHEGLSGENGRKMLILDNDLRRNLVDHLPHWACLTAILDSCHSGTLLDLNHHCSESPKLAPSIKKCKKSKHVTTAPKKPLIPSGPGVRIFQSQTGSTGIFRSRKVFSDPRTVKREPATGRKYNSASISRLARKPKPVMAPFMSMEAVLDAPIEQPFIVPGEPIVFQRCMSPDPIVTCTGDCPASPTVKPHVVSLAACHDPEVAIEGEGWSMTTALIEALKKRPHPPLQDLMKDLRVHLRKVRDAYHASLCLGPAAESDNSSMAQDTSTLTASDTSMEIEFPDFLLASEKRLDMQAAFRL